MRVDVVSNKFRSNEYLSLEWNVNICCSLPLANMLAEFAFMVSECNERLPGILGEQLQSLINGFWSWADGKVRALFEPADSKNVVGEYWQIAAGSEVTECRHINPPNAKVNTHCTASVDCDFTPNSTVAHVVLS